ncbi:non-histone protein 10, partial [Suhomyces tanzawaensis NRRL Y-17324]
EQIYRRKCEELRKRVIEVEGNNEVATLALSRTKAVIRRLRLEYSILLERLEERATLIPNGINSFEEMAAPPIANVLDDSTNPSVSKLSRNGVAKKNSKKTKSNLSSSAGSSSGVKAQKVRDPDLPKRPTNAYLIFCELEKDRIKQENEIRNPGVANDLSKSMTEAWKNLDEEERKPYYKLYEDDRTRYQTEMLAYNQKKQINGDDLDEKRLFKKQKVD